MTTTRSFVVKGQEFFSPFSDAEAIEKASTLASNFAKDLVSQARNGRRPLSSNQIAWLHKLVVDSLKPKTVVTLNVSGIISLFATAKQHLKYPKIRLTCGQDDVVFKLAGPNSKHAGCIQITNGVRYGERDAKYFGQIDPKGNFDVRCSDQIRDFIVAFSEDPAGISGSAGRLSGNCVFCGLVLTDERSLAVGRGPVCSDNWGLPWGDERLVLGPAGLHVV
jgi:hypothetical protein